MNNMLLILHDICRCLRDYELECLKIKRTLFKNVKLELKHQHSTIDIFSQNDFS